MSDADYIHLAVNALKQWQKEHPGEHCDVHVWLDGDEYKVEIIPRQWVRDGFNVNLCN